MKNTINITVEDMAQYVAYKKLFTSTGYTQIGTRLFEDNKSYVRITIKKIDIIPSHSGYCGRKLRMVEE